MKNKGRKLMISSMIILMIYSSVFSTLSFAEQTTGFDVEATSAIIMEANTGQILYGKNENEAKPPASMAKMMTEYLVMEAIDNGDISWDDMVRASAYAANIPGSGGLVAEGDQISVRNLFRGMSIYSGNDATVVLAEHVANTEENFVRLMNEKAKEMGLSDEAHFINSTGLDKDYIESTWNAAGIGHLNEQLPDISGNTLLTAYDAAKIAQRIILDHPEVLEIASVTKAYFIEENPRERELMENWNWMLEGWAEDGTFLQQYAYEGADGLKTGFTDAAGYCFTGTAERDGIRLITVVMGTESTGARFVETAKLMDYAFDNFTKQTILLAKSSLEEQPTVSISKGREKEISVVADHGIDVMVDQNFSEEQVELEIHLIDEEQREAPLSQGDVLGVVEVTYASPTGDIVQQVNLVASEDAEKAGWFRLMMRAIGDFFTGLFNSIKNLF